MAFSSLPLKDKFVAVITFGRKMSLIMFSLNTIGGISDTHSNAFELSLVHLYETTFEVSFDLCSRMQHDADTNMMLFHGLIHTYIELLYRCVDELIGQRHDIYLEHLNGLLLKPSNPSGSMEPKWQ